ncbi:SprT-like domain-containing protein [bacterium]|jgi:predicted SprT family Zn-dependent metalloprotease|nr:SprT-like domain-containing protein [bacterium]
MDRHGQTTLAERLRQNPTAILVGEVLADVESTAFQRWTDSLGNDLLPHVTANGLTVPIVRVSWNRVDDFFQTLFDRANHQFFGNHLPPCRRVWNRRFRGLAGRIQCRENVIELSSAHFEQCGAAAMGIVLVHEMIHLALFTDRLPFGHTGEFKRRSLSVGLPRIYHELPLPGRLAKSKRYRYRCVCGQMVLSRIKFRQPRACAHCCKKFSRGRFDPRFTLVFVDEVATA